mmetsp:Transcript_33468/g.50485  ORF Transcript_33468/g.50485 Transcript_33468/m.50485 type:complete len:149 (-) Transcript_33468:312-758(-)
MFFLQVAQNGGGTSAGFILTETDNSLDPHDHRVKGRLQYVGEHQLRFGEGEWFLKVRMVYRHVCVSHATQPCAVRLKNRVLLLLFSRLAPIRLKTLWFTMNLMGLPTSLVIASLGLVINKITTQVIPPGTVEKDRKSSGLSIIYRQLV